MVAVCTLLVMVEKSVWGVWWLWSGSPEKVMKNTFTSVQTTGVENHDSLHLMGQKKRWCCYNFCRKKYLSDIHTQIYRDKLSDIKSKTEGKTPH